MDFPVTHPLAHIITILSISRATYSAFFFFLLSKRPHIVVLQAGCGVRCLQTVLLPSYSPLAHICQLKETRAPANAKPANVYRMFAR